MADTTGGTMTPPRSGDDEFAPVIPLRRRGVSGHEPIVNGTPDEQARGIWDPDAPPTDLPTRPSVWDQPAATQLLARPAADDTQAPAAPTTAPARRIRRFPGARWTLAALTVAAAVLVAVFAIAPGVGPSHPHALRTRTTADAHTPEGRQIHTTVTSPDRRSPTRSARRSTKRRTTATRGTHPATHAKQPRNTKASKVRTRRRAPRLKHPSQASQNSETTAGSPTTVGTSAATTASPPTTVASSITPATVAPSTPPHARSTAPGSAASQCVPGELGC